MRKRPEVVSATTLIAIAAALLSVSVAALVIQATGAPFGSGSPPAEAAHGGGTIALAALDMDTSGNTVAKTPSGNAEETTLGAVNSCVAVTHPATFDIDFVLQGYPPASDSLVGYDVSLTFPAGLTLNNAFAGDVVPSVFGRTLISGDPQSGGFFSDVDPPNINNPTPLVGPATHSAAVLDFAPPDADENVDGEENSDGFLVRYTFQTTAAGPALLDLTPSTSEFFVIDDLGGIPITLVAGGQVAVNEPCPVLFAENDDVTVAEDSGTTAIDVMFNDGAGPGSLPLTITDVSDPAHGTATINGDVIDYTPDLNFNGSDPFDYTIKNKEGDTDTATVNVTVDSVPDAPVTKVVNITVLQDSGVNSWVPDVRDDDDDDLKCLTSDAPEHGIVTVTEDCTSGTYRPRTGFSGSDSFTYQVLELVEDPHDPVKGTVNVNVVASTSTPVPGASPTPTAVAGATATPTPTAAVLPSTGDGISLGGGGSSGLTFLAIGLVLLVVAPGTVAVGVILRRKAKLGR
jgi:hypothetical protein